MWRCVDWRAMGWVSFIRDAAVWFGIFVPSYSSVYFVPPYSLVYFVPPCGLV